jgi:multidrug transporter EmrE-like cation transporter
MRHQMTLLAWLLFLAAAVLEVGGDAVIRKGLRGGSLGIVVVGCVLLAAYGLVVNLAKWDFSKLLGIYVTVFALVSVLFGRFLFREDVPIAIWADLGLILAGGLPSYAFETYKDFGPGVAKHVGGVSAWAYRWKI